jgi:hypothetical protein
MVKVKPFEGSELESFILRSVEYGATTETFVFIQLVVLMMRVGLQSSATATTCVLIPGPGSSFRPSDEQGPNKYDSVAYQRPSRIEMAVAMVDHKNVIAAIQISLKMFWLASNTLTFRKTSMSGGGVEWKRLTFTFSKCSY